MIYNVSEHCLLCTKMVQKLVSVALVCANRPCYCDCCTFTRTISINAPISNDIHPLSIRSVTAAKFGEFRSCLFSCLLSSFDLYLFINRIYTDKHYIKIVY